MKKLQSVLGDHHDAVVARGVVRELGVRAHLAGENAFSFGVLYQLEGNRARGLDERAEHAWKRASGRKYRRWLR
jgi:CHAD domain-containing protein